MYDGKPYGTLTSNMVDQSPNTMYNVYLVFFLNDVCDVLRQTGCNF